MPTLYPLTLNLGRIGIRRTDVSMIHVHDSQMVTSDPARFGAHLQAHAPGGRAVEFDTPATLTLTDGAVTSVDVRTAYELVPFVADVGDGVLVIEVMQAGETP